MEQKKYIAHIAEDGREQTVEEHLCGTAKLSAKFAAAFGAEEAGRFEGLAHDIGKCSDNFQNRILRNGSICDHSTAGALECEKRRALWAACCVLGHHRGLLDLGTPNDNRWVNSVFGNLCNGKAGGIPAYRENWDGNLDAPPRPPEWCKTNLDMSFFIRMLYSCLVDADFLDTERFMRGNTGRNSYDDMSVLEQRLLAHEAKKGWDKPASDLNQKRFSILHACREAGKQPRGLYTLTVPTGGGKTVASLAFALRHAIENKMDRVIYIVPYTSIIEQNAQVFREILGDNNVLEHHAGSLAELYENATLEQRKKALAAENWDMPVVVTTAVRFFESMYASKSSKCRRLHNLANSVLIFDEAQMLPVEHLKPCVAAIAHLVKEFQSTAVLCTATQPALGDLFQEYLPGMEMRELCPKTTGLWESFKRVTFRMAGGMDEETLAAELAGQKQVLCIVNTRKTAKRIFDLLPEEGSYHLSTLMYPAHRRAVLEEIRDLLKDGKQCRVVSTSLVEAGVDIDFPMVYREKSGLDSILQAAGRCNREGEKPAEDSIVTVFDGFSSKAMVVQSEATRLALLGGGAPDAPETIRKYFQYLFKLAGTMDKYGVIGAFKRTLPFESVAERFRLIDNTTKMIYIPEGDGQKWTERLLAGERSRELYRQAGQYGVSVYEQHFKALEPVLTILDDDSAVLNNIMLYDTKTGLPFKAEWGEGIFIES